MANDFARTLRKNQTDAEALLWRHLRNRHVKDCKFRRQHAIGPYVVDFVCLEQKLAIEADGGQHAERELYDEQRTSFLNVQGHRVLRFWDSDMLQNIDGVLEKIWNSLDPSPQPIRGGAATPPRWGEGADPAEAKQSVPSPAGGRGAG